MRQQVMTAPGNIEYRDIPKPIPQAGQVLMRVERIGICGSDIHVYHGKHPFTSYPVTQGHEASGRVEALGPGVEGLVPGQTVAIQPQIVCGECHPCRNGKYNLCESLKVMGFQTTGTASDYFVADARRITPLPAELSMDEGAMIEPLAVAVHAVQQAGQVVGSKVCVLGAGPIGNLVAQVAKGLGAAQVMIADLSDWRLKKAAECGVDDAVNLRGKELGDLLLDSFGPDKADVIFDCAGNDASIGQAIKHARKGSVIILVAVFDQPARVDLATLNDHELRLDTSMMYRDEHYRQAIELVRQGRVALQPLISAHFAFEDFQEAYAYIDANRETTMKVLIDLV